MVIDKQGLKRKTKVSCRRPWQTINRFDLFTFLLTNISFCPSSIFVLLCPCAFLIRHSTKVVQSLLIETSQVDKK